MKSSLILLGMASAAIIAPRNAVAFSISEPDASALRWDSEFTVTGSEETRKGLLGYLTVPLDYYDAESPNITLRVRAVLSNAQPASQGPLLFHCGGPGSDDTCTNGIASPSYGLEGAYPSTHESLSHSDNQLYGEFHVNVSMQNDVMIASNFNVGVRQFMGIPQAYVDFDGLGITQRGMNIPVSPGTSTTPMPTDSPYLDCPVGPSAHKLSHLRL